MMALLGQLTVGIIGDLTNYSKGLTQAQRETIKFAKHMESTGRDIAKVGYGFQDLGQSLTNKITKPALTAAGVVTGLVTALGFKRLIGMDNAQAKLKGLGVEGKRLEIVMEDVKGAVQGTTHTMAEGADVAAGALAAGVKEGAELERYVKLVGDAATGSNRSMADMAMIFNRVQGAGKLMTMELNMIEHGMPGFEQAMASALDVPVDKMKEMVTEGKVTSEQFLNVMDDFAGGMSEAFAGTWQGITKNILSNIGIIGEGLLSGVFDLSKEQMGEFLQVLRDSEGLKNWAKETGESIRNFADTVIGKFKQLKEWWDSLSSSTQDLYKKIALYGGLGAIAIGPLLLFFGKFVVGIGNLITRIGVLQGAFVRLTAGATGFKAVLTLLTGPVGVAIGIIAALIATGVLLYKNWEKIKEVAQNVFTSFEPLISVLKDSFQNLKDSSGPIMENLKGLWESLIPILQDVGAVVGGVVVAAFGVLASVINGVLMSIGPLINAVINFVDFVVNMVNVIVSLLKGDFSGAWDYWQKAGQSALDFFVNLFNGIIDFLVGFVDGVIGFFKSLYMTLVGNSIIPDMVNAIVDWFKNMFKWVVDIAKNIADGVVSAFTFLYETGKRIFNAFWGVIQDVWKYIENTFKNALDFLKALVTGDFEGMKKAMENQMQNARELLFNIWGRIKTLIGERLSEILTNLIGKFTEMVSNVRTKATEIVTAAREKFEEVKQNIKTKLTESVLLVAQKIGEMPGKVRQKATEMLNAGKDLVQGLINGIKQKAEDAIKAVTGVIDGVINTTNKLLGRRSPSRVFMEIGQDTVEGYNRGIEKRKKDADKVINNLFKSVLKITKDAHKDELKAINNNNTEIKRVEQRTMEDINLIKKKALDDKRKLTQAELIRIRRIEEDAAKKIQNLQAKNNKIEKDMAEKQSKELLKVAEKYIYDKRKNGEMSIQDEIYFWNAVYRNAKKGSEQYELGMKNHQAAVKALRQEVESTNKEHNDRILQAEKEFMDESGKLWDDYINTYTSTVKRLTDFAGLFDEFAESVHISGQTLIDNLQSQVTALDEYSSVMNSLDGRIDNFHLTQELKELGVKSLDQLKALNNMSDDELNKFVSLYEERFAKANEQATKETEWLRESVTEEIEDMKNATAEQLDGIREEWEEKVIKIVKGVDKEFDSMKQVGIDAMQGLSNGMESMRGPLMAKAQSIASAIQATIASAFDIQSPSRWMRDFIGKNMMLGWIEGIDSERAAVLNKATQMAEWMRPEMLLLQNASNLTKAVSPTNALPGLDGIVNKYDQSKKQENNITINTYDSGAKEMERTLRRLQFGM